MKYKTLTVYDTQMNVHRVVKLGHAPVNSKQYVALLSFVLLLMSLVKPLLK